MPKYNKFTRPERLIGIAMKGDGINNFVKFLKDLQTIMANGSSGDILIQWGDGEKKYSFDGDGADRIINIIEKNTR
jgi:hypothetical protein